MSVLGAVKEEDALVEEEPVEEVLVEEPVEEPVEEILVLVDLEFSAPVPRATATTAMISITTTATTAIDLETASLELRPLENRLIRCGLGLKHYLNIRRSEADIFTIEPSNASACASTGFSMSTPDQEMVMDEASRLRNRHSADGYDLIFPGLWDHLDGRRTIQTESSAHQRTDRDIHRQQVIVDIRRTIQRSPYRFI